MAHITVGEHITCIKSRTEWECWEDDIACHVYRAFCIHVYWVYLVFDVLYGALTTAYIIFSMPVLSLKILSPPLPRIQRIWRFAVYGAVKSWTEIK